MNYQETLNYLFERLPMFQRIGPAAFKKDLDNTLKLMDYLGHPYHSFKSIHIGGTNGKGTVSHLVAALLVRAGYKTGIYTSPHYKDIRERIKSNDGFIEESYITTFVGENMEMIESVQPSYFELLVAMAFSWFRDRKLDWGVIEVGLGGRLDSTNVISPQLSVITNISYDHQNMLGDTLEAIAGEKAGIIKKGIPAIIGERQSEVASVFEDKAVDEGATILFASEHYRLERLDKRLDGMLLNIYRDGSLLIEQLETDLTGDYQLRNLATAMAVWEQLVTMKVIPDDIDFIRNAWRQVRSDMGLLGRMQILDHEPLVLADSAHNPAGILFLIKELAAYSPEKIHFVFGMVNDKSPSSLLALLPSDAHYYWCKPDIPRGLDTGILSMEAAKIDLYGDQYDSVRSALQAARSAVDTHDIIVVCGSIFVVAELL